MKIRLASYLRVQNLQLCGTKSHDRLSCKMIASELNVTPATLANLSTSSKYELIDSVADVICKFYSERLIKSSDYDKYQVMQDLIDYSEWLSN